MNFAKKDLAEAAADALSRQSYNATDKIDGVIINETSVFTDDGGSFTELGRFSSGGFDQFLGFQLAQINASLVLPGTIKAFHLHLSQDDIWYVPPTDRLLIILSDQRKDSPTVGKMMRFILGGGKSRLVYIPRGVAHGVANLWNVPAAMTYFVNQKFNQDNPDEHRLPWDFLGTDIWEITRG